MGVAPSAENMLYESVQRGNVQAIRSLHAQGASINWMRSSGKTPLTLACSSADRLHIAKLHIELGADVNYYHQQGSCGTAIQNAAKRGLEKTVDLLLSHGANPLLGDLYRQNALDRARERGHTAIVRAFEVSSLMFDPKLENAIPPNVLKKIGIGEKEIPAVDFGFQCRTKSASSAAGCVIFRWATHRFNRQEECTEFLGFAFAIILSSKFSHTTFNRWAVVLPSDYTLNGNARELLKIALYNDRQLPRPFYVASLKNFHVHQPDFLQADPALVLVNNSSGMKLKLLSGEEGDTEQLKLLYDTCRGADGRRTFPSSQSNYPLPQLAASVTSAPEEDKEIAIAIAASIQSAIDEGVSLSHVRCGSAGAIDGGDNALTTSIVEDRRMTAGEGTSGSSSSCVICSDAPAEAACVPCGHLAGCMACMTEVKVKEFGCPVCRAKIERIMKIYAV